MSKELLLLTLQPVALGFGFFNEDLEVSGIVMPLGPQTHQDRVREIE
jgi:hypothetical protein